MPRMSNPKCFIAVRIPTNVHACEPCRHQNVRPQDEGMHTVPYNSIMVRDEDNAILINGVLANIESYRILVPDMIMQIRFVDGAVEKTRAQKGDTFDVDTGLRIAIAKHCGRQFYNLEGIEDLARRLSHLKCIDKMLKQVHKYHDPSTDVTPDMLTKKKLKKKARNQCDCNGINNTAITEQSKAESTTVHPKRKEIKITRSQHSRKN